MSLTLNKPNSYTLGRGILRVKKTTDTAWQDLVHCKEFKLNIASEELEHENVRSGLKIVDKTVTTKLRATGQVVVDSPIMENVALFFMGDTVATTSQTSGSWTNESFTVTAPDKAQSLGKRKLTITSITDDTTPTPVPLVEGTDYYIDLVRGLFTPLSTSSLVGLAGDGFKITGTYGTDAYKSIQAGATKQLIREIWFAGDPGAGIRQDVKGYCTIKPNGDFSMIGEEWESMTFDLAFNSHAVYGDLGLQYFDLGEVS